jgi:hypothetical protein
MPGSKKLLEVPTGSMAPIENGMLRTGKPDSAAGSSAKARVDTLANSINMDKPDKILYACLSGLDQRIRGFDMPGTPSSFTARSGMHQTRIRILIPLYTGVIV